jgi:hypothetical protein
VRWQQLFDDLDGQAHAAHDAERLARAREQDVLDLARLSLMDRLGAAVSVGLVLSDGARVHGAIGQRGTDWLTLRDARGEVLVLAHGIELATGSGGVRDGAPLSRVRLRTVLRGLVRRRCYVVAGLRGGEHVGGTLDAVGADHVEMAVHDPDVPRRAGDVRAVVLLAIDAVCWLRYEER